MRNKLLILIFFAAMFAPGASQAQTITLKADSLAIPCHDVDTFLIPIRVFDFNTVAGLQFTFEWNPAHLDYAYITDINPAFFGIGFDTTTFQTQGKFTFSWTAIGGLSLPDSAILLQVAFTRLGGPASLVGFSDNPTAIAAIDPLGNDLTVQTAPGLVSPVDTEPPTVVCPANVAEDVFGPSPINNIEPASILDNCSIQSIGWSSVGATTGNHPNDPDASGAIFDLGQSTVTYLVTDVGGNTASCSFLVNLTLMPGDSLTLIASNDAGTCGETITINISALNFDSISGLQFSLGWDPSVLEYDTIANAHPSMLLDITNFGPQQAANGFISFAWTSLQPFGLTLPDGSVLFSLTFNVVANSNSSTNINFGNFPTDMLAITSTTNPASEIGFLIINGSVVISDTEPPAIQCPANMSVSTPPGVITADFNNLDPLSLTDNCGAAVDLTYVQTGATTGSGSGSANGTYDAGTTIVTYTATDGAGNTTTCSFSILVDAGTPLTLILDTVAIDCQDSAAHFSVDVSVRDFTDIIGMQFDIEWDSSIIRFDSVDNFYPGLGFNPTMFFGYASALNGNTLKFFGGNAGGWPTVPDDSAIFTIHFTVKNLGTSNLNFTGTINAVNSSFNFVPVAIINGLFQIADLTPPIVTCQDLVVPADSGACVATLMLDLPQAMDVCSGIMSIVPDNTDSIFQVGQTVVIFTATDDAGNTATCSTTVTVQGDALPQLTNCPADITVGVTTAACTAGVNWVLPDAVDPCDGSVLSVIASDTSGAEYPLGDTVVTFMAFNLSGDTVSCAFTVSVHDSLPPSVSCPSDYLVQTDSGLCTANVVYDLPIAADNCDQSVDLVGDQAPGNDFSVGMTLVTYSGTDDSGNTGTCVFTVTVFDLSPPVIDNCPDSLINLVAAPDSCEAAFSWADLIVTDDCSQTVALDPANYTSDIFPIGTTPITITATDAGGNITTCTFSVTVTDTVPPSLSNCPFGFFFNMPADKCDTLVTWTVPTAFDFCGLDTLIGSSDPMTVFPTGTHTVTYTAYDLSGNTATCSFVISVIDAIPPVFNGCPMDTVIANASPCGVVVDWILPTATDNCLLDTIISTKQPTDTIFDQITNVVIRAVDASGNADTCSFTITLDVVIIPPAFVGFPTDTIVNGCPQPVFWTLPISNGHACNPDTVVWDPAIMPGDTFQNGATTITYYLLDLVTGDTLVQEVFTVTVQDTMPPVLSGCPTEPIVVHVAGFVVNNPLGFVTALDTIAGCAGVEVSFGFPTAVDDCGNAVVDQTAGLLTGEIFPGDSISTLVFTATDDNGNEIECIVNVAVVGLQPLIPTVDPDIACPGDEVILMVDAFPGASYTWTGPNQTYPDNSQIIVIASPQNAGEYTVSASLNGCTTPPGTAQVTLASVQAFADTILVSMDGIPDTFNVAFNDIVLPDSNYVVTPLTNPLPDGLTYLGGGVFAFLAPDDFRPLSFFYELCSSVCPDVCDTVALVTIRLNVTDCAFIPNVFTPNSDGVNDYFRIQCLDSEEYRDNSIVIYNQWGDKVFDAAPYDNMWRGTLNGEDGKDLPDGVYYYIFKSSPGDPARKGFIQIHR